MQMTYEVMKSEPSIRFIVAVYATEITAALLIVLYLISRSGV